MIDDAVIGLQAQVVDGNPGEPQVEEIHRAPVIGGIESLVAADRVERIDSLHHGLRVEAPERPVIARALSEDGLPAQLDPRVRPPETIDAAELVPSAAWRLRGEVGRSDGPAVEARPIEACPGGVLGGWRIG